VDVFSPAGINAMLQATPGAVAVSYGGASGYGHLGLPPGMAFEDPELSVGRPAVVVAAGYFPRIGVDRDSGLEGVAGTNITVDGHVWRISRVMPASEDGGDVLLLLTKAT
jgi:hypothetical protein